MTSRQIDLKRLLGLAERATPGPWHADLGNWQIESRNDASYRNGICTFTWDNRDGFDGKTNPIHPIDDAEFIAALNPDTVKRLILGLREASIAMSYYASATPSQFPNRARQALEKLKSLGIEVG